MEISEVTYRRAEEADTDSIMLVINDAKCFLAANGVGQWQDGFPDRQVILEDISTRMAYVLTDRTEGANIIGFFVLSPEDESSYAQITGNGWINPGGDYATIHRTAISSDHRGKGMSALIFSICEEEAARLKMRSIRIDTHKDNDVMRHIIIRNGYTYCGIIRLSRDNAERMAYEKLLT